MREQVRVMAVRYRRQVAMAMLCLCLAACGTGIEVTERVTDKDVQKVIGQFEGNRPVVTLEAYKDSVPAWSPGKRFWVADNQARLLFARSADYDIDTVDLAGRVIAYQGYDTGGIYDNRQTVNLLFGDTRDNRTYVYRTGKTIDEFRSSFTIPMLIDMDMVDCTARQIVGKDFYVRTPIWYDQDTEQRTEGRHFIKVHIDSVLPGNSVMPMRVLFHTADTGKRAMVWMNDNPLTMIGRDFDAMFVATDPHLSFPDISNENWERITRSEVVEGMTKEECRLALGAPKRMNELPDQAGLREYWYYDGGSYLFFMDGLLKQFRR